MKRNTFVVMGDGTNRVRSAAVGYNPDERESGIDDTEDSLIQAIDEKYMPSSKLLATRFLTFLGNQRLTVAELKLLPKEEQQRLKKEFLENN